MVEGGGQSSSMNKKEDKAFFLLLLEWAPLWSPASYNIGKASTCHWERKKAKREGKDVAIVAV